jgi:hypothetical protein
MRVFEVMTEGVQTVTSTMPASDAWELMRGKRVHHLVVTGGPKSSACCPNATWATAPARVAGSVRPLPSS